MGAARVLPGDSVDEFLAWEMRQPERYELVGGVVTLMAGGTEGHDRLSMNIARLLGNQLRGGPCRVHGSNLKVMSRAASAVMYPDVFVRCGPAEDKRTSVEDAVVVFEVLSESTAKQDLTRKRRAYMALPSLRRIVFVSPDEVRLDLLVRTPGGAWDEGGLDGLDGVLELPEIGAVLAMAAIYEDTAMAG
jgi:Uma2 family endonuclease